MRQLISTMILLAISPTWCPAGSISDSIELAAAAGKHTYVLFYRANDVVTARMERTIQEHVERYSQKATWIKVHVYQSAESGIVKKFDATRIPLPAVFCLSPNGAVSGVHQLRVEPQQLASAILTPKYADMVKALQEQKIVVVCLQPAAGGFVPQGVSQFENSADFQGRTHRVTAEAHDAAEAGFFDRMQIGRDIPSPMILLFAPPGVHLGTYEANVSGATLAMEVHKSGQCNCEKCRRQKR